MWNNDWCHLDYNTEARQEDKSKKRKLGNFFKYKEDKDKSNYNKSSLHNILKREPDNINKETDGKICQYIKITRIVCKQVFTEMDTIMKTGTVINVYTSLTQIKFFSQVVKQRMCHGFATLVMIQDGQQYCSVKNI